jgi:hypothetical protein
MPMGPMGPCNEVLIDGTRKIRESVRRTDTTTEMSIVKYSLLSEDITFN